MAKKIDRIWKYFKCPKCGREGLSHFADGTTECECNTKIFYDETIENQWLNEVDEKGERIRMDFEGSSEQECREQAARYFACDKEDISNYYIVQKAGLFKKFVICATRPVCYEADSDAVRIVMWEYEDRPRIWLDINTKEKTILYPNEIGDTKIRYNSIKGIEVDKTNTLSGVKYLLDLEPQGKVALYFYPSYEKNFGIFLDAIKNDLPIIEHGMFTEEFFCKDEFNPIGIIGFENASIQINSGEFNYKGYLFAWKNDAEICFCNSKTRVGYRFPLKKIRYYRLLGQKYVTTEINGGGGGGSSIKGAIIGGLIAGGTGAVIGSRKAVDEINGKPIVHDEQKVLLYDNNSNQVVQFNSEAYEIFTKIIPEKEYAVVISSDEVSKIEPISKGSDIEAIEKLAGLYNKGILTKQEFESKKAEILSRI